LEKILSNFDKVFERFKFKLNLLNKIMHIAIDGNEANVNNLVGVSVYTLSLLKYFEKVASEKIKFTVFLRNYPNSDMPEENEFFQYEVIPAKILWSQIFLPFNLMNRRDIDVFFSPAHYSPRFMKQPLVVTIHDLSYKYFPNEFLKKDLYKLESWSKRSIMKAKKVIAVSKTTKKDVIRHYGLSDEKIKVIYNGFLTNKTPKDSIELIKKKFFLKKNEYLLHVGTIQPRKNIIKLIRAFEKFYKNHSNFKLVLVGKKGWLYEKVFDEVKSLNLESSIIFTGYVTEDVKSSLYSNAYCLVFPSLYEGFGIPILEAMSHLCPVVASHSSSLPEVGGDSCLYFDPNDENDLNSKLEKLFQDKDLYKALITNGNNRVKNFSWEKCAKETLEVITSVVNSPI